MHQVLMPHFWKILLVSQIEFYYSFLIYNRIRQRIKFSITSIHTKHPTWPMTKIKVITKSKIKFKNLKAEDLKDITYWVQLSSSHWTYRWRISYCVAAQRMRNVLLFVPLFFTILLPLDTTKRKIMQYVEKECDIVYQKLVPYLTSSFVL